MLYKIKTLYLHIKKANILAFDKSFQYNKNG